MNGRYLRQASLVEQTKLAASRVAVVGAGGLGSAALYCLAGVGIGNIKIIDCDAVEVTNLNRQFIHNEADLGVNKALSASRKITNYNNEINVTACGLRLTEENVGELISGCDLVVACVDNKQTRLTLNKCCVELGIPLVDGGVCGFEGYVLTVLPGVTPCLCCLPGLIKESEPCDVIGAAASAIGSMMAAQAIKTLSGIKQDCFAHYVDLMTFRVQPVKAERDAGCGVCGRAE